MFMYTHCKYQWFESIVRSRKVIYSLERVKNASSVARICSLSASPATSASGAASTCRMCAARRSKMSKEWSSMKRCGVK
jgi:hypothetical protein